MDGCIATLFVDLLYQSGSFSVEEARDLIEIGCLNALFVAGRSIGFIGSSVLCVRVSGYVRVGVRVIGNVGLDVSVGVLSFSVSVSLTVLLLFKLCVNAS